MNVLFALNYKFVLQHETYTIQINESGTPQVLTYKYEVYNWT